MVLKVCFFVDDFSPVKGKGLERDEGNFGYLKRLNNEFGMKFTMMTVPMMNGDNNNYILKHPSWCDWVNEQEFIEIQSHGYIHKAVDEQLGAQEFANLPDEEKLNRIKLSKEHLEKATNKEVSIFRAPGWFIDRSMYSILKDVGFKAVADHVIGNKVFELGNGLNVIPYTLSIDNLHSSHYDDVLILHSHFDDDGGKNKNCLNDENYRKVRDYVRKLKEEREIEFVFVSEMLC